MKLAVQKNNLAGQIWGEFDPLNDFFVRQASYHFKA